MAFGERSASQQSHPTKLIILKRLLDPFAEPVVGRGPFVMNTYAEIQQAFGDYQLGRMREIAAAIT